MSGENDMNMSDAKPVKKGKAKHRRTRGGGTLQKEKNGTYTIRAIVGGKRISKATGTSNKEEAEKFLREFMLPFIGNDKAQMYDHVQSIIETEDKRLEREREKEPQLTLEDGWDAYLKSPERRDLAEATLEGKKLAFKHFTDWMDERFHYVKEMRHVTKEMVELYLADLRTDHSASTYNNRLCVLREMFRVLGEKAMIKNDPWARVKLRDDDSHSRRELTIEELKRLAKSAAKEGDEFRKVFAIGVYTGLRLGDCCQLEWKEVDIVRSIIQVIPQKTRKYSHGRPITIPIHAALHDILCETPEAKRIGYVLPRLRSWYTSKNGRPKVSSHISKIFRNAGIVTSVHVEGRKWKAPEATFHSLRHTFVSMSANAGVPLHIVQAIVGHESTAMTRHYYHESEKALRQAVSAIPTIGETRSRSAIFQQQRLDNMDATGVEYFPDEQQGAGYVEPTPQPAQLVAPVKPLAEQLKPAEQKPEWQTMRREDVQGAFAAGAVARQPEATGAEARNPETAEVPEVLPPEKKPVVIPQGAKVEIREFGRVYVDGVATGGRIGGVQARPRPPKQAWFGQIYNIWSRRRHLGVLEGTMDLVSNGGQKFLTQLWERNTVQDPSEAVDICEAYLKGRGVLI